MPEPDASGLGQSPSPEDDGSFGNPGDVQVLGTNSLQTAIDKFDVAVTKLSSLYDKAARTMPGCSPGQSGGGTPSSGNGGGATFPQQGGPGPNSSGPNSYAPSFTAKGFLGNTYQAATGKSLPGPATQAMGGFMGRATIGGQPTGTGSVPPGQDVAPPDAEGGGIGGGASGADAAAGASSGGAMGAGFIGLLSGISSFGAGSMSPQVAMSNMQQQGTLLAPAGSNNRDYGDAMRTAAFGQGGRGLNTLAFNAQDAATGFSTLQQMSGSGLPASNAYGQAGASEAAAFGYANPTLGYAGSTQLAQQMNTPQMSLRMTQLGYGATPLTMGGGASQSGDIQTSLMQRWYGKDAVDPKTLGASLRPGVGVGYENLQSLGYDPEQIQTMSSTMEAYNRVAFQGKMSNDQVQQLFTKAQTGDKQATSTLSKYGVTKGDLQSLKTAQASSTGMQSDMFDSFSAGLSDATTVIGKFRNALDAILNIPGLNQLVGESAGATGAIRGATGGASNLLSSAGGLYLMSKGLKGAVGKAGGKAAAGSAGGADAAAGATGAGEAGAAGAAEGAGAAAGAGAGAAGAAGAAGLTASGVGTAAGLGAVMSTLSNLLLKVTQPKADKKEAATKDQSQWGVGHKLNQTMFDASPMNPAGWSHLPTDLLNDTGVNTSYVGDATNFVKGLFAQGTSRILQGMPGVDDQHVVVQRDEAILNPNAAKVIGYQNIERLNRENPNGQTKFVGGVLHAANGATLVADAEKYNGHKYVWGGAANPKTGWDCSSFMNYELGTHGVKLPGGFKVPSSIHGPATTSYLQGWGKKVDYDQMQPGDIYVNSDHMGMVVGKGKGFAARSTATGTGYQDVMPGVYTILQPPGLSMDGKAADATTPGTTGTGTTATASTGSTPSAPSFSSAGGGYNDTSEASNVMSALGGGAGGVSLGVSGSSPAAPASTGSTPAAKSGNPKGSGPVGSVGNIDSKAGFASALLKALGDPASAANMSSIEAWETQEGGNWNNKAKFNPLNTTQTEPGSSNPGFSLGANIQAYTSWQQGVQATVTTLENGRYGDIIRLLKAGQGLKTGAASDIQTWGTDVPGVATGGTVLRDGSYIVGERGPEVAELPAGTKITDAKRSRLAGAQGVAQMPWQASAAAPATATRTGAQISLNFSGDINIQGGTGTISKDSVSNSAQEIFAKVKQMMQSDQVIAAIASGEKHG